MDTRRVLRSMALAGALAVLTAGSVSADDWMAETELPVRVRPDDRIPAGTQIVIKGQMTSERAWCRRESKLILRRHNDAVLARTRTHPDGRYRFEIVAEESMRLRVWFRGKEEGIYPTHHVCLKSRSETIRIRAT
jgi:hypothetical protein